MRAGSVHALAIGASLAAAGIICADQTTLSPSKDNTLYEDDQGDVSNALGENFFVGRVASSGEFKLRRGLIEFDVSSIPAGSTINSVTLQLTLTRSNQAGNVDVSLHQMMDEWGEGTSDAGSNGDGQGDSATTGDATWLHEFYPNDFWSLPGAEGDYVSTASATVTVGTGNNSTWQWESSTWPALISDVEGWVNDPSSNSGWIVIGDESGPTTATAKRFGSRQHSNTARRPMLTINFTPPAGTGACCFTNGTCQILTEGDCITAGGTYSGNATVCVPNDCPQPMGACCVIDTPCFVTTLADCTTQGGSYQGDDTGCDPDPCISITGACCFSGAECTVLSPADCMTQGGEYLGDDTTCEPNLCPLNLEKFVDPLPIPPIASPISGETDVYDIAMVQFQQQLHRDLDPTTMWGYGPGPNTASPWQVMSPGPIIVATRDVPTTVTWGNDLRDEQGNLLTEHYLTVDPCPHGAPLNADARTVVHLHGGHVPEAVDGYPEDTYPPGQAVTYTYPNNQEEALIWFHDHALGITRLNVYMGLAGAYVLDDPAVNPPLPSGAFDVPLVVQDRVLDQEGQLVYPADWQDMYFGDLIMVNGKIWPFLNVKKGKYRFRLLEGSNSRTYTFSFRQVLPGGGLGSPLPFSQIATDGGYLEAPVPLTELTMAPGERTEVVFDFEGFGNGDEILLYNTAPTPFPGDPGVGVIPEIMKFVVEGGPSYTDPLPATLEPVPPLLEGDTVVTRELVLSKESEACAGSHWLINGLLWDDITEFPVVNTTEVWEFVNQSGVMHPMHLHLDFFQILNRQAFDVGPMGEIVPVGPVIPPDPNEVGWKDTARVNPGEILRVIAQFRDYLGLYAYHCHILEHEDHEMMRQFQVIEPGPECPADIDGNGSVDVDDLTAVILGWGPCPPEPDPCPADIDGNGSVDVDDLTAVILGWGPCPAG